MRPRHDAHKPPSHLSRVEELEFWSTGGKARVKHHTAKDVPDTVTISTELYERLLHATKHSAPDASVTGSNERTLDRSDYLGTNL